MNNYIRDTNPLDLAKPPAWWLAKLFDFDDSLVVIPSRMAYCYRLCQRRRRDPRAKLTHEISQDSDSKMLARYGLVPVTTIIATARWDNPLMWEDLRQRMPSRMGGAEAYERKLLEKEYARDLAERQTRNEMLDVIAKDSLGYYRMKKGVQSNMYVPKTKNRLEAPQFSKAPLIKIASPYAKLRD